MSKQDKYSSCVCRMKCIHTRGQTGNFGRLRCHNHAQFRVWIWLAMLERTNKPQRVRLAPHPEQVLPLLFCNTVSARLLHPSLLVCGGDIYLFYFHSVFVPSVCALEAWSFHITLVYAEYWTRTGFQVFNESRENTLSAMNVETTP